MYSFRPTIILIQLSGPLESLNFSVVIVAILIILIFI